MTTSEKEIEVLCYVTYICHSAWLNAQKVQQKFVQEAVAFLFSSIKISSKQAEKTQNTT